MSTLAILSAGLAKLRELYVDYGLAKLRELYIDYARTAFDYEQAQLQKQLPDASSDKPNHDGTVSNTLDKDTGWSDNDASNDGDTCPGEAPSASAKVPSQMELESEFNNRCFRNYRKYCQLIDWKNTYPDLKVTGGSSGVFGEDQLLQMWDLELGRVMKQIISVDPKKEQFGFLPYMTTTSRGSVGAFLASSFCKRINSAANIILHDGNLKLGEEEINTLTVLQMNRSFIDYMRKAYPNVSLEEFRKSSKSA